jgi:hypothetical protein
MAFYLVTRTDFAGENEYDSLVVRAKGKRQALNLVTGGTDGTPFDGFHKNGSNAHVEKLIDGRDTDNRVIIASYVG